MFDIVLKRTFEEFSENFKVALSFAVLFIFVVLFVFFEQFFLGSGTVFLSLDSNLLALIGLVIGLVFLYAFSFFVSLCVYSIQRDIHHLSLGDYWNVLMKDASLKIFLFYLLISVIFYVLSLLGLLYAQFLVLIIMIIISSLLMYVPQSIVLEEKSIWAAIDESISFWVSNPVVSLGILAVSSILLFVILLIEYAIDLLALPGIIVSFALVLIILIPFVEQMKSYAFILKNDLIRAPEVHKANYHKPKPVRINATRLHEKHPGGKI